jgi:hypothetical protein
LKLTLQKILQKKINSNKNLAITCKKPNRLFDQGNEFYQIQTKQKGQQII